MDYVKELRELVGQRPLILTGAVVLILNQKNEVLLQHRNDGTWGLPGGLMELGESLEDTARREVNEETGLEIGALKLLDVFSGPDYYLKISNGDELYSVTAVYLTDQFHGDIKVDPEESIGIEFFSLHNLPEKMAQGYRNYIESYTQYRETQLFIGGK